MAFETKGPELTFESNWILKFPFGDRGEKLESSVPLSAPSLKRFKSRSLPRVKAIGCRVRSRVGARVQTVDALSRMFPTEAPALAQPQSYAQVHAQARPLAKAAAVGYVVGNDAIAQLQAQVGVLEAQLNQLAVANQQARTYPVQKPTTLAILDVKRLQVLHFKSVCAALFYQTAIYLLSVEQHHLSRYSYSQRWEDEYQKSFK